MRTRLLAIATTMSVALPCVVEAQKPACQQAPLPYGQQLSGPRFGFTYLTPGIIRVLRDSTSSSYSEIGRKVNPIMTQFGWQFEREIFAGSCNGPRAVNEWILLAGGMEQGLFLPSLTWLVGVRLPSGREFGVGPNLSAAGLALALAGGVTTRYENINFPINVAVVPSRHGARISILSGFNTVRR
jgi:hypothetical protein